MNITPKQIFYTENNVGLYYLSPYAKVVSDDDGVFLGRADTTTGLEIDTDDRESFFLLLQDLRNGIKYEALKSRIGAVLPGTDADVFLGMAIQEGVIE